MKTLKKKTTQQSSPSETAAFKHPPGRAELYAMGKSDAFDKAIAAFSSAYADQSERDHEVLMKEVRTGRLEVVIERE